MRDFAVGSKWYAISSSDYNVIMYIGLAVTLEPVFNWQLYI